MRLRSAINIASKEFFQATLVTYLLLTLAEVWREGFVSNFFNMNYLLIIVLISGVAMVLSEAAERKYHKRVARAVIVLSIRTHKRELTRRTAMQHSLANSQRLPVTPAHRAFTNTGRGSSIDGIK